MRRIGAGLLLVLLAASAAPARHLAAQAPARVSGRIYDAGTGAPLADAEVSLGDLRALTGGDGTFRFGSVTPGRVTLQIRRLGYAPWRGRLDVAPGLDREVTVAMAPLPVRLDSVLVVAAPGAIAIGGDELVRRGHDLGRALDGWEGVVVRRSGPGGPAAPQVRGGGPDEVLVLVDGFAVNDPLTGRADLSTIPTGGVHRVTLVPGVQTVRHGHRAVAGVLMVDTRTSAGAEATGWVGSHGNRGFRVGGSAGRGSLGVSGERHASRFGYAVPEVRGGGTAARRNAGGTQYTLTAVHQGPVHVLLRASASDRGLPGTTTNPTPAARASDRAALLGLRAGRGLRWQGTVQWLETRAADTAPPTGPSYDAYTRGLGVGGGVEYGGAIGPAGWRGEGSVAIEVRGDRFGGDGVRRGASFSRASLRAGGTVHRGDRTVWSLAPAARLDGWTDAAPRASLRLDASVRRGATTATLGVGSGVTPPVLADLLFREGVGVRLNPDLRPERVPWEIEGGLRHDLRAGRGTVSVRGFYGRVEDMIVWAPDFRFIWSPHNFDVRRAGGEAALAFLPVETVRLEASAAWAAVTYDRPGGAQVQYRPRTTYAASAAWTPPRWVLDLRWRRIGERFPNSAGTNPRPAIALVDISVERELAPALAARGELRDVTDARAEFIAGYPTPGRTFTLTLELSLP